MRFFAILILILASACASARGRHNAAVTFEAVAGATLATGTAMVADGLSCYEQNDWNGSKKCDEKLLMSAPFVVAGNVIFWIAEPARRKAAKELKEEGRLLEIDVEEFQALTKKEKE